MIGQTLGHYRIIEKIGAGGMGEVYRAHDEQLDRDVALKLLPPGTMADDAARKKFRREAMALARLNHPNIETVHDFGSQDGTDFLVMELIPGRPLSEALREGPLPEKEILRLGTQLADGLAAAHAHGVVHRDLKPGNLMITSEDRLKILDFGLARLFHPEDPSATRSLTKTQAIIGTLPYMSPEQVRGEAADVRSDIYGSGVALYEMATGRRPFPQTQSGALVGAILHESPTPPRGLNSRITLGLEAIILKALDKERSRRYQSARELLVALEGVGAGHVARSHWPTVAAASTVLVVVLLVGLALGLNVGGLRDRLLHRGSAGNQAPVAPIKARRSVAVLGFKNLSGRPDEGWLSSALSEMLTTELAAGGKLRTIPAEDVAQMKISLSLPDADSYGKETLSKIRKNLGSDEVVLGSYLALGSGQIRLDLKLEDAATGEIVDSVTENGKEAGVADLVSRTGASLRTKLGVGEISAADADAVEASLPSNPDATRYYAEGLAKLRQFDTLAARDLLGKAVAASPDYALAHSALAAAWSALGYDAKAQEEAKKAFDLSSNLSREDRLWIEAQYRETTHEWNRAMDIYRALWDFFPDNLNYALRLTHAEVSAGRAKDALNTIEVLRQLPPPARDDARIDLTEANAARSLSDFQREQAAAARAGVKAEAQGARLMLARARLSQGGALADLGETEKAIAALTEAKRIFEDAGDKAGVASTLNNLGNRRYYQGDWDGAKGFYEASLAVYREIGAKTHIAGALNNLASVLSKEKDLARAMKMREESLAIYREIGDKEGEAVALGNIGNVLYFQGDLVGAKNRYQKSLAIRRETGARSSEIIVLNNLAEVLRLQGDLAAAKRTYEDSAALCRELNNKKTLASALSGLGQVLSDQGNVILARKNTQEALEIRSGLGQKMSAAQIRAALADFSIEEGKPQEAEGMARDAAVELENAKQTDEAGAAYVVLAKALLAQRKFSDAQEAIDRAASLSGKSEDRAVRFAVAITSARVRAALGKRAQATDILEAILVEATKHYFVGFEFEARLALREIEVNSGNIAAGRAHLAALEKDATTRGFLLVARKAVAASR